MILGGVDEWIHICSHVEILKTALAENKMMREALEHSWLLEELECSCGYYGDDTEETGMSECPKCAIKRVRIQLDRAKLSKKEPSE